MRVFNRHFLLGVLFVTALAYVIQAKALDVNNTVTTVVTSKPVQTVKPAPKKYCPPKGKTSPKASPVNANQNTNTNGQSQGQAQGQQQGQSLTNTNTAMGGAGGAGGQGGAGGNASSRAGARSTAEASSASSVGNTSASGGSATSNASNGGNVQSTTDVVQRSAPAVSLGIIAPNGCGAGAQGGGSNTRGAMMAGFAWTTDECYAFILAQSYQAIGQLKAACELLNTTNAAKRATRRGFALPTCEPEVKEVTRVVTEQLPGTYTQEQVNAIVRKAVSK